MSQILYEKRCRCKEDFLITKKPKSKNQSEGKPFPYPSSIEVISKTFQIRYDNKLSSKAKLILYSLKNKYLYYAIDDILYLFKSNLIERDSILDIVYSTILSIHNNFSISFFDIWIQKVYINEVPKMNKFLEVNSYNDQSCNNITLKLIYKPKILIKKHKSLW